MTLEEIQSVTFDDNSMLDEYKTKPLTRNSLFLINGNHYIVGAVGSGKTTLLSKLIVIYKQRINPFILYFSNFGADETMALNLNSKNIVLTNITYEEAMYFLPQFDEIMYSVKEVYTYWKLRELNISYKSDYIQRMKERIVQNNPIKENPTRLASASVEKQMEKPRDYARRIAQIFEQECIDKITKYSVPTMIMRFTVPAIIHNVYFERKLSISQEDGDAELKITKIPILFHSSLLNSLLIFDDIGSNADIQRFSSGLAKTITHLVSDTNGDFAFSAERGTVWMNDNSWYNSGDIVPDQVTPASDAIPLVDSGTGVAGTSNEYSRGDHKHPLQVSDVLPAKDTVVGEIGTVTTYARSDHTHHVNLGNSVPKKDTGTGTAGSANVYSSATHQHPLNIDPITANVPLVNATAAANGTSDYYCRNDHVHPQQLTYTGPLTSTMFIKNGAQATDVLLANGDSKPITDIAGDGFVVKTGKTLQAVQGVLRHSGDDEESEDDEDYITRGTIYNQYVTKASADTITGRKIFKNDYFQLQPAGTNNPLILFKNNNNLIEQLINSNEIILTMNTTDPVGTPLYINYRGTSLSTQYPNSKLVTKYVLNAGTSSSYASVTSGNVQINPSATGGFDDGLRIARTSQDQNVGSASIELGCSRTSNSGVIQGQWVIYTPSTASVQAPQSLIIAIANQASDITRGLQISIDGNTLSFNGQVIAQTNPTTGQTTISSSSSGTGNGSVNYSAGNPILWGLNGVDTNGGFYSDGPKVY
ncbi:MAG: hypothetical protein EZS28_016053 [Streblomastix strix]|uniref:Uncharacterized protein n=1 Tax=Streblomastix strix TaxID=222440 RepID=A0A5J4W1A2_9EUKA|nr:MAG: hypothetical protein EZS28_016053 [Streblomastix strix]